MRETTSRRGRSLYERFLACGEVKLRLGGREGGVRMKMRVKVGGIQQVAGAYRDLRMSLRVGRRSEVACPLYLSV